MGTKVKAKCIRQVAGKVINCFVVEAGADQTTVDYNTVRNVRKLGSTVEIVGRQSFEVVAHGEERLFPIAFLQKIRCMATHDWMHVVVLGVSIPLQQPTVLKFLESLAELTNRLPVLGRFKVLPQQFLIPKIGVLGLSVIR